MASKAEIQAAAVRAEAARYGLRVSARDGVVTVYGTFTAGDAEAYARMEANAYAILAMCRQTRAGSVWGTDSGSVGGYVGLKNGYVELKKSGVDKRLAAALA